MYNLIHSKHVYENPSCLITNSPEQCQITATTQQTNRSLQGQVEQLQQPLQQDSDIEHNTTSTSNWRKPTIWPHKRGEGWLMFDFRRMERCIMRGHQLRCSKELLLWMGVLPILCTKQVKCVSTARPQGSGMHFPNVLFGSYSLTKFVRFCTKIFSESVWHRKIAIPVHYSTCAAINGELVAVGAMES